MPMEPPATLAGKSNVGIVQKIPEAHCKKSPQPQRKAKDTQGCAWNNTDAKKQRAKPNRGRATYFLRLPLLSERCPKMYKPAMQAKYGMVERKPIIVMLEDVRSRIMVAAT